MNSTIGITARPSVDSMFFIVFDIMAASRSIMNSKPSAEINFTVLFSSSDIFPLSLSLSFPVSVFFVRARVSLPLPLFCCKCKILIHLSQTKATAPTGCAPYYAAAGQDSLHTPNTKKPRHCCGRRALPSLKQYTPASETEKGREREETKRGRGEVAFHH